MSTKQDWTLPRLAAATLAASIIASLSGCNDLQDPAAPADGDHPQFRRSAAVTPSPLVAIGDMQIWPYTGTDLAGTASDPINLIFPNQPDPRVIRAALMGLSGNRSMFGFPDVAPFNCTWADAVGGVQTTWTSEAGWVGSAIQLECGEFDQLRFHLRLFPGGGMTLGGAHFEVLVPGTQHHEVLSWEFAERIVQFDLIRAGAEFLGSTAVINPAPSYDFINPLVFNSLPLPLRAELDLPLTPQSQPVPRPNDGMATIMGVTGAWTADPGVLNRDFVIQFGQVIPKPFCASGPFDYVYVSGPINVRQRVVVTPSGNYISNIHAQGRLEVTPVNPLTSPPTPIGATFSAIINEKQRNVITNRTTLVSNLSMQTMLPPSAAFRGRLMITLNVGPGESSSYDARLECN
jgi:hypothetical protein